MSDLIDRQAAIDVATSVTMEWDGMYVQDLNVRIREAIKQLPSTNCSEFPNNSDTISRQAAIDGKICIQRANGVEIYDDYAVPVEYLKQLPSAQPEPIKINIEDFNKEDWERFRKEWANTPITVLSAQPKKGRWISADAIFHGVPFYCSECGENTRDTVMGKPRWKFCPMCGSRNEVTE